jgi:hypothetical protein
VDAELRAFRRSLRDDPTLMRHLFLAKDLLDRVEVSPTAGAGLLDVAEALAPKSEQKEQQRTKDMHSILHLFCNLVNFAD